MQSDTRDKNKYFDHEDLNDYFGSYIEALADALDGIKQEEIGKAIGAISGTYRYGGRIFVAGNGGSSAIAEHLTCDLEKGCHVKGSCIVTHSLSSNTALMTAIANDLGYENVFSYQLETQRLNQADVVILISSSGNSPNIVKAAEYALKCEAMVIGMSGFNGGRLNELADIKLHVPFENYGIVEDAHQAVMHSIAQAIYLASRI